ncbi:MAG: hypothetical protein ABIO70_11550 [Pseudomonadota bacterium]
MSAPHSLTPAGERCWEELRRIETWAQDTWLAFVFTDLTPTVLELRARLAAEGPLTVVAPREPEALAPAAEAFTQAAERRTRALLILPPPRGAPDRPLRRLVSLLNERRQRLISGGAGLVVIAPLACRPLLREGAPDLWAFRSLVQVVDDLAPPAPPPGPEAPLEAVELPELERADPARAHVSLQQAEQALERGAEAEARDAAVAALGWLPQRDPARPRAMALVAQAARQGNDLVAAARWQEAAAEAWQELEGGDFGREAMVASANLATDLLAIQRVEEAEVAGEEAVRLARVRRATLGDRPDVLRDLSVSLERLGDVQAAGQRHEQAERSFQESLELSRQLRATLGDRPDVLRELAVSLERLGGLHAKTDTPGARALLEEAVALGERLARECPQLSPPYDPEIPRAALAMLPYDGPGEGSTSA